MQVMVQESSSRDADESLSRRSQGRGEIAAADDPQQGGGVRARPLGSGRDRRGAAAGRPLSGWCNRPRTAATNRTLWSSPT